MKSFPGFPAGKMRFTPIPDMFYTELLPLIDDLAELKLTLYMFWSLNRQRGYPRYLTTSELEGEGALLSALQCADRDPTTLLREAVESAVERGTLLRLSIRDEDGETTNYLFLNTPQGRKAVEEVERGDLLLETTGPIQEAHVEEERPNILELYEQNIGLLQPLLVEELQDAENTYPPDWISDAFRISAENNVRNWRYIKRILERWAHEGKDDGNARLSQGRRPSRYPWRDSRS